MDLNKRYYKSVLTEDMQKAYELLEQGIMKEQSVITVPRRISPKKVSSIIEAVLDDHPEFYYVKIPSTRHSFRGVAFNVLYTKNQNQRQALMTKVNKILKEMNINNSDTDYTKCKKIHNWIVRNIEYDYDSAFSDNDKKDLASHTIENFFTKKKAVCSGISKSFKLLCDLVGVPCIIVKGIATDPISKNTNRHQWNIVELNNELMHFDITWDLSYSKSSKFNRYDYFGFTDAQALKERQFNIGVKCQSSKENYFNHNRLIFRGKKQMDDYIKRRLEKGHKSFYMQIEPKNKPIEDIIELVKERIFFHLKSSNQNQSDRLSLFSTHNLELNILFFKLLKC